jgi:hypothetical protein
VPDRKLYRLLHPGFDRVTLLSGGGKSECIALARHLGPALATFTGSLRVRALVDRDVAAGAADCATALPVSMIENFLLDPEVIFEAIESVLDRTPFQTVDDVRDALAQLLASCEQREIERRAAARLGAVHFHPPSDLSAVTEEAAQFAARVSSQYAAERVAMARSEADADVTRIRTGNRRREEFDGKKVVADFFRTYLSNSSMSKPVFTFYAAKQARRRRSVVQFFDGFLSDVAAWQPPQGQATDQRTT